MNKKQTFTVEVFLHKGELVKRIHVGDFESNRDFLSPQMYEAKEIEAATPAFARAQAHAFFEESKGRKRMRDQLKAWAS